MTTKDLSGTYCMNRKISGDTDECLSMQGVGWMTRKTLSYATVTVKLTHTTNDAGVETIQVDNTVTGGIKGSSETRILDWEWRSQTDHVWGTFKSRARRVNIADVEVEYLKTGWEEGTESLIEIESDSTEKNWSAVQTWGFQIINGERRYARQVKLTAKKPAKTIECRMAYDFYP